MGSKVIIGSDHNGNAARAYVIKFLTRLGVPYEDVGPTEAEGKVDYPEIVDRLVWRMRFGGDSPVFGILICGTGTGMSIAANKHSGIRAGIGTDRATAELMRDHNDANVLCLGQWRNSLSQIEDIVYAFLSTPFGEGRHVKRVEMLRELDRKIGL